MRKEWELFNEGVWCDEINVRDFILKNITVYEGDDSFLAKPTAATKKLNVCKRDEFFCPLRFRAKQNFPPCRKRNCVRYKKRSRMLRLFWCLL